MIATCTCVCCVFATCRRVFATFTRVRNVLATCFHFWPTLCVRHVFETCLQRVCPMFSLLANAACSPRVCNVFDTCLQRVATCFLFWRTPRVCNVSAMCLTRVLPPGLRHVFTTCLQHVFHVFPLLAYAVCSPRVWNVFDTCLGNFTPIKLVF